MVGTSLASNVTPSPASATCDLTTRGMADSRAQPAQAAKFPFRIDDVAREHHLLRALRLEVSQHEPLQDVVIGPIFTNHHRRVAEDVADGSIKFNLGHGTHTLAGGGEGCGSAGRRQV